MKFKGLLIRASEPKLICDILGRDSAPIGDTKEDKYARRQLLAFLGSIVIAGERGLYLDGSVPERDLKVAAGHGRTLNLKEFEYCFTSEAETTQAACNAINVIVCSGDFDDIFNAPPPIAARFENNKVEEMKQRLKMFHLALEEAGALIEKKDYFGLTQFAGSLAGNTPLWGNKLLSGLVMTHPLFEESGEAGPARGEAERGSDYGVVGLE